MTYTKTDHIIATIILATWIATCITLGALTLKYALQLHPAALLTAPAYTLAALAPFALYRHNNRNQ